MLRSTQNSLLRPLAATGIIAAAAMMAPVRAEAQTTTDAALLNRLAPTIYVPGALSLVWNGGLATPTTAVDGEVALLARPPAVLDYPKFAEDGVEGAPVSGTYALLGRREAPEPARRPAARP